MKIIPIIIDTDPGVDDFFCLALACAYQDVFTLKLVTTIGGNNHTEVTTKNALDILALLKQDTPVAKGAMRFLEEDFPEPVAKFHGANGLADLEIPHTTKQAIQVPAWDAIYQTALDYSGDCILVTVGPLTNIAMALQKYADLPKHIKKIVMMGGTITEGNISPYAEANVGHDAKAASIVFNSGIPIDMVGLNVTKKCPIDKEKMNQAVTTLNPFLLDFMNGLIDFRNGESLHDAIAIASLIDPSFLTWEEGLVDVVVDDEIHQGQTVFTKQKDSHIRVAVDVNLTIYQEIIRGMILRLQSH